MLSALLFKVATGLALILAMALSWSQLTQHTTWHGHDALAAEVRQGRSELRDLSRVQPLIENPQVEDCRIPRRETIATLHLYAIDLRAREIGANPFLPAEDQGLTEMRMVTWRLLNRALACAPLNGDFWLSLAVVSRSLGEDPARTAQYLAMSARYAPYEGWISDRRARSF